MTTKSIILINKAGLQLPGNEVRWAPLNQSLKYNLFHMHSWNFIALSEIFCGIASHNIYEYRYRFIEKHCQCSTILFAYDYKLFYLHVKSINKAHTINEVNGI